MGGGNAWRGVATAEVTASVEARQPRSRQQIGAPARIATPHRRGASDAQRTSEASQGHSPPESAIFASRTTSNLTGPTGHDNRRFSNQSLHRSLTGRPRLASISISHVTEQSASVDLVSDDRIPLKA